MIKPLYTFLLREKGAHSHSSWGYNQVYAFTMKEAKWKIAKQFEGYDIKDIMCLRTEKEQSAYYRHLSCMFD